LGRSGSPVSGDEKLFDDLLLLTPAERAAV
jgi:hypothetical protein